MGWMLDIARIAQSTSFKCECGNATVDFVERDGKAWLCCQRCDLETEILAPTQREPIRGKSTEDSFSQIPEIPERIVKKLAWHGFTKVSELCGEKDEEIIRRILGEEDFTLFMQIGIRLKEQ